MKKILTLLFLLGIITRSAFAANYYIDCLSSSSSDNNDGLTHSTQWKTIAHAQTSVAPGDTVNIASGNCGAVTFNSSSVSGTSGNHITYKGVPGTVFSSLTFAPTETKAFYCDIKDLKIAATYTPGYPAWNNAPRKSLGPMVSIGTGTQNILLQNLEVTGYIADDGLPATYEGIRFYGGASNVVIDRLNLHALNTTISGYGIATGGSGNIIKNTKIHDVMGSAISTFNGLASITNTVISDEIPQAYYPSHPGGSGLAMRGGNITLDNIVVKNYGFTRPVMFYQNVAGPDGYQNVNVSNLLVYYTVNSVTINNPVTLTPSTYNYNKYIELIDVGNNFNIKNSTLPDGALVFLAINNDGSGLGMYNNLIGGLTLNNHYDTTTILMQRSCVDAFVKWDQVQENNNIFGKLTAWGGGYLCAYDYFTPTSASVKTGAFPSLFVNTTQPTNDYRLSPSSQAINFGNATKQPTTSLGLSLIDGFVVNGISRGAAFHSAGAYEPADIPIIKTISHTSQ